MLGPPSRGRQMVGSIGILSPTFQPKRSASLTPVIAPVRVERNAYFCSGGSTNSG